MRFALFFGSVNDFVGELGLLRYHHCAGHLAVIEITVLLHRHLLAYDTVLERAPVLDDHVVHDHAVVYLALGPYRHVRADRAVLHGAPRALSRPFTQQRVILSVHGTLEASERGRQRRGVQLGGPDGVGDGLTAGEKVVGNSADAHGCGR